MTRPRDTRRCKCGSLVGEHASPEYTIAGQCDGFDPAPQVEPTPHPRPECPHCLRDDAIGRPAGRHPCCPKKGHGREIACIAAFRVSRSERPIRNEKCGCSCHRAPDPRIASARILAEVAAEADRIAREGAEDSVLATMRELSVASLKGIAARCLVVLREKEEEADGHE